MTKSNVKIDTSKLRKKVNAGELKEAYETVDRKDHYRIGAGARMEKPEQMTFFLEGVISLCEEDGDVRLEGLRSKMGILETFESFGYTLKCEKDNSVICEKKVLESEIEEECERLEGILQDLK